jgi:hypothetical protein
MQHIFAPFDIAMHKKQKFKGNGGFEAEAAWTDLPRASIKADLDEIIAESIYF